MSEFVKRTYRNDPNETVTYEDMNRIENGIEEGLNQINVLSDLKIKGGNRDTNTSPSNYYGKLSTCVLKEPAAVGLQKYGSEYVHIIGYSAWGDDSAFSHEIAFQDEKMYHRASNLNGAWKDWHMLETCGYKRTELDTNLLTNGKWYLSNGQNPTNDWFYVEHYDNPVSGYSYQIARSPFANITFERRKISGEWTAWEKIMTQTQIQALIDANNA